jgi:hypothetical protein
MHTSFEVMLKIDLKRDENRVKYNIAEECEEPTPSQVCPHQSDRACNLQNT